VLCPPRRSREIAERIRGARLVEVPELGQRAASRLLDVGGASIVQEAHLLDRHWRNIRTLAGHNPTLYKGARDPRVPPERHPVAGKRLRLTSRP
jgi:hypothetical protein